MFGRGGQEESCDAVSIGKVYTVGDFLPWSFYLPVRKTQKVSTDQYLS